MKSALVTFFQKKKKLPTFEHDHLLKYERSSVYTFSIQNLYSAMFL